jgi:hypothetical protein
MNRFEKETGKGVLSPEALRNFRWKRAGEITPSGRHALFIEWSQYFRMRNNKPSARFCLEVCATVRREDRELGRKLP